MPEPVQQTLINTEPPAPPAAPAPSAAPAAAAPAGAPPAPPAADPAGSKPPASSTEPEPTLLTGNADQTPQDKPKGTETPAATLSLKPPEGVSPEDPGFVKFTKYASEKKLSQEQAQGALEMYAEAIAQGQAKMKAAFAEQKKAWAVEAKADKEVGGEKLASSLTAAKRAIDKYGSPGLRTLLDQSGLGNHPEVIRLFARVGKTLSEDSFAGSLGQGTTPASEAASQEQKLRQQYPSMFPKKEQ